jgi:hypothetical protein
MENFLAVVLLFAVFWGFMGAVIGHKARGRGELGAILGAMLGPIGIACLFVMGDSRTRCRHCRSVVDPAAAICRHCQKSLAVPPPLSSP